MFFLGLLKQILHLQHTLPHQTALIPHLHNTIPHHPGGIDHQRLVHPHRGHLDSVLLFSSLEDFLTDGDPDEAVHVAHGAGLAADRDCLEAEVQVLEGLGLELEREVDHAGGFYVVVQEHSQGFGYLVAVIVIVIAIVLLIIIIATPPL